MLTAPQRHDLLILSPEGRETAWQHRDPPRNSDAYPWRTYPDIPAIFTGQTVKKHKNLLRIGFSYPMRIDSVRYRIASYVPQSAVLQIISPWEVARHIAPGTGALNEALAFLYTEAFRLHIPLGIFGSTALQVITGLDYLHPASDLDLVLGLSGAEQLRAFGRAISQTEKQFGIQVDAELKLGRFQYVKLKELLCTQKTVMVKGGTEPQLLSRREVLNMIQTADIATTNH